MIKYQLLKDAVRAVHISLTNDILTNLRSRDYVSEKPEVFSLQTLDKNFIINVFAFSFSMSTFNLKITSVDD